MRILVVTNLYPPITLGGYETCCGLVVDRLRERNDVCVLTSDERADDAPSEPWIWRRLPLFSGVSGDTLTAALVTHRAIREVRMALARFRPDFAFVWAGARIPKGAIRILETSGVPLAFSVHDWWFDCPYDHDPFTRYLKPGHTGVRAAWAQLIRLCNRLPSLSLELNRVTPAAVCWNSNTTRSLTSVSPTIRTVLAQTIYPATIHEQELCSLPRSPSARTTVVFVGRVTPEKGPAVALRAMSVLARAHQIDADLVICGYAAPRFGRELDTLAHELGVSDRVRTLGSVTPEALAGVLASAHVLIVPPTWQEPFGLTCLEGALARVPVVASLSGGMTEILADEEHALFFPIGDHTRAAAAIARVLAEPRQTAERVARAFVRARTFSVARYLSESESFVQQAYAATRS
jgi:glycosyltransferase involved in cell wall biosynthesis